jgi:hypothetical protein
MKNYRPPERSGGFLISRKGEEDFTQSRQESAKPPRLTVFSLPWRQPQAASQALA